MGVKDPPHSQPGSDGAGIQTYELASAWGGRGGGSGAERERSREPRTLHGGYQVSAWEDKDVLEKGGGDTYQWFKCI